MKTLWKHSITLTSIKIFFQLLYNISILSILMPEFDVNIFDKINKRNNVNILVISYQHSMNVLPKIHDYIKHIKKG